MKVKNNIKDTGEKRKIKAIIMLCCFALTSKKSLNKWRGEDHSIHIFIVIKPCYFAD